ncbi:hypothetical protein BGY98DRAFT_979405, partial [Russula aff. rugulosa BPL654]
TCSYTYITILSSSGLSAQLATSCHLGEDSPTEMMRHVPHLRPGTRYHDTLHLPEKLLFSSGSFLSTQFNIQLQYSTCTVYIMIRCSNHYFRQRLWRNAVHRNSTIIQFFFRSISIDLRFRNIANERTNEPHTGGAAPAE